MKTRLLMTGAATLHGAEILRRLLALTCDRHITLLVPAGEEARRGELERLESYLGPLPAFVTPLPCDLRLPRFGLSLAAFAELADSFDAGFHCARRETRDQDLARARAANVRPVENWIQLLERNPSARLHHLSTAFVGGTRRGLLTEFDLDCGQGFNDAFERSMFEAESRLRESRVSERVTVYRPSHLLGRSDTGEAFCHGGAYPLLATLAAARLLPGDARARLDFVPADYVAAAVVALACSGASGTFHLACGWETSPTTVEAAALAASSVAGRGRTRGARLLPRGVAWPMRAAGAPARGDLSSRGAAYANARNLLHPGPVFDTYLADMALGRQGVARPAPADWLEKVVRLAEDRGWERPPADESERPAAEASLPSAAAELALARREPAFREKRFHQVGDVNVAYRDIGEGGGEPVVLLHGFSGAHSWDGVAQRLASRRRVLVVETLGLGDTEGPRSADYGLAAQAARVRGLLSALGVASAHVVGNDAGGVMAQIFATRWPHIVRSLVLSDCGVHGAWPPARAAWAAAAALPGGAGATAALLKVPALARSGAGFGRMVHDRRLLTDERLAQYLDAVAGSRQRRAHLRRFLRSLEATDLAATSQLLAQLEVPTMIVWGADDANLSPSWAKSLYDTIPGARRLELIPFAGASCHEERPDIFARLLDEFFDGPGAEPGRA
ncbi:MAG TPA: alpha/beta fold hydrolase [Pyrinomonadaceae bacterium]|jgi:pimeloyl-ACP methyl ester carboxylesterase/nucleoside-diphosphate-sugar epimerase